VEVNTSRNYHNINNGEDGNGWATCSHILELSIKGISSLRFLVIFFVTLSPTFPCNSTRGGFGGTSSKF
jgi:hypothetical protein